MTTEREVLLAVKGHIDGALKAIEEHPEVDTHFTDMIWGRLEDIFDVLENKIDRESEDAR